MNEVVIFGHHNCRILPKVEDESLPQYEGFDNVLINPDRTHLLGVPLQYYKKVGDKIEVCSEDEAKEIDNHHFDNSQPNPPMLIKTIEVVKFVDREKLIEVPKIVKEVVEIIRESERVRVVHKTPTWAYITMIVLSALLLLKGMI